MTSLNSTLDRVLLLSSSQVCVLFQNIFPLSNNASSFKKSAGATGEVRPARCGRRGGSGLGQYFAVSLRMLGGAFSCGRRAGFRKVSRWASSGLEGFWRCAEVRHMNADLMMWSLASVCLFCLGCSFLIGALRERVPVYNESRWSKKALGVKKSYKVFCWGLMTCFFLGALVMSFYEVFTVI